MYQELWLTVNGFVTVDQSLFLFAYIGIYMVAERVFVK